MNFKNLKKKFFKDVLCIAIRKNRDHHVVDAVENISKQ